MSTLRKKLSWIMLTILFFANVWIQEISTGATSPEPTIYLDPFKSAASVGATFTVNINVTDIPNTVEIPGIYGWQVNMTFNPLYINVTKVDKGPFLRTAVRKDGKTTSSYWFTKFNYTSGWFQVAETLATPYSAYYSGAFGSGVLAIVTFKVITIGGCLLKFALTKLRTVLIGNLVEISHKAMYGTFDNRTENVSPVASFHGEPSVANVSDIVSFDASVSYDPDAWLYAYNWDFGDGTTKRYVRTYWTNENLTAKATNVYNRAGIYLVTLTVTDNDGATSTATTSITIKGHDVAVTNVKSIYISAMQGVLVPVNVTVANNGDFTETFNVTAYYNETAFETQKVIDMPPHTENLLTFTWNTTSVDFDRYLLKANATIVEDDYDTSNNEYIDGTVAVALTNIVDYPVVVGGFTFHVIVESNSTPSNYLQFSPAEKKIGFNVEGKTDTPAFCNVTIPVDLLGGPYTVLFDDSPIIPEPQETTNGTHTFLYFTYTHSMHTIQIIGQTIAMPPIAIFTISTTRAIAHTPVTFNATDSYARVLYGTIESYKWNFSDGNTTTWLTDPIITHAYTTTGNYTVTLTVKDNKQLTNSTQAQITVIDYPTADFSYLPTTPLVGEIVTFNASASEPNGGSIINYAWEFGDGGTGTGVIATHSYSATGNYTVKLTVTDSEDLTNSTQTTITVINYPKADFTYTPEAPLVNQTITFDATASKPNGGAIKSYTWEFDDGKTGTGVITTHSYSATGNYTVTLTITDSEDLTSTTNKTVTVKLHNIAITSLTASPNTVKIGEPVTIEVTVVNNGNFTETFTVTAYYNNTAIETKTVTDLTSGGSQPLTIVWNTEDVSPDVYTVKAEASNVTGETKTDDNSRIDGTVTVQKKSPPIASFTYTPSAPKVGDTVTFTSNSTDPDGSIQSWDWNFGDGTPHGNTETMTHTYATAGDFTVNLTVTDNDELTATKSITITVQEAPQAPINLLYVAGAAVIIILIVTATAYFLRIRKPKVP